MFVAWVHRSTVLFRLVNPKLYYLCILVIINVARNDFFQGI